MARSFLPPFWRWLRSVHTPSLLVPFGHGASLAVTGRSGGAEGCGTSVRRRSLGTGTVRREAGDGVELGSVAAAAFFFFF